MKKNLCCLLIYSCISLSSLAQATLWEELPLVLNSNPVVMYYDSLDDVSYIGGHFTLVNEDTCNLVKWDGNTFTLLPSILYNINTITRYKGKIYVGGGDGLASWDGNSWTLLDDKTIYHLYVHGEKLYVAGSFSDIGGTGVGSLATWNDTVWSDVHQLDTFINSEDSWLKSVISYQDQLYVIGMMNTSDGTWANIIRFDGTRWRDVGGQIQGMQSPFANDLLVWNDTLYVSGFFREDDGGPGNGIAAWDGNAWHRLRNGVAYNDNPSVTDMIVFNDELYITGWFYNVNGININIPNKFTGLAKWDGSQWCTLGTIGDGPLQNLGNFRDSLYLMGSFEILNDDSMKYIVKWIGGDYTDSCSSEGEVGSSISENLVNEGAIVDIYPNPVDDVLNIRWRTASSGPASFAIYDITGREVMKREIGQANQQTTRLPVSRLSQGMYLIKIAGDSGFKETHRFIKE